jgi:hypothetical protein
LEVNSGTITKKKTPPTAFKPRGDKCDPHIVSSPNGGSVQNLFDFELGASRLGNLMHCHYDGGRIKGSILMPQGGEGGEYI